MSYPISGGSSINPIRPLANGLRGQTRTRSGQRNVRLPFSHVNSPGATSMHRSTMPRRNNGSPAPFPGPAGPSSLFDLAGGRPGGSIFTGDDGGGGGSSAGRTSTSAGGGGVSAGRGVGSGGSIYFPTSFPSVTAAKNDGLKAALAQIEKARQSAAREKARLDRDYDKKRTELQKEFQFAETAQEKAQIARIMGNLESQRDDGYQAIGTGYAAAIGKVESNAAGQRESAGLEAASIAAFYNQAADGIAGDAEGMNARYDGFGVNSDGGATIGLESADAARASGASEAALSQRLGNLGAEDATWLASTMGGEREAQQADLNRLHMVTSAGAQETHASRVQQRIHEERNQWRQQLANLQQQFTQRGWTLGDQGRDMMLQAGNMQFQAGEAMASRNQAASEANQRAAQMRQQMQQSASSQMAGNSLQASMANAANALSAAKHNSSMRQSNSQFNASQRNAARQADGPSWMTPEERAVAGRVGMRNDLGPEYQRWQEQQGNLLPPGFYR